MTHLSRRGFLASSAGLVIGVALPLKGARAQEAAAADAPFAPNAFIRVAPDDTVTVMIKHIEFGQGPNTGLATLVAEEMDADWSQMRAESAPADPVYANALFGMQGTGGSTAMASSWEQMRKAGAAARAMLVAAAAAEWGVPAGEITVSAGRMAHSGTGKTSGFGTFATKAATMPMPEDPPLKDPSQFVLIGTDRPKLDTPAKTDGSTVYTMDVMREGMLTVVVAHPPAFGATVKSLDDSAALAVNGVEMVRQIPEGVAVYARSTYPALKARELLEIEWDFAGAETRSTAEIMDAMAETALGGGRTVEESGDLAPLDQAEVLHEAEFRFPYLAHAPMEPLNAVIEVKEGGCEMWYGCQFPGVDHQTVAAVLGLPTERVRINVLLAGGSFGRRATGDAHLAVEAANVARAAGRDGAFKLIWTREDDLAGGYYRPMTVHRFRAGMSGGAFVGWENTVANQSIMKGTPMEAFMQDGLDSTSYEGSTEMPYDTGARRVGWAEVETGVPVLWWRSVGHTHTAYATEVFLDEVLEKAGIDPVQGRLDMLKPEATRERGVIEAVRDMAGWQGRTDGTKGYGIALAKSFNTYVAEIAEVENAGGFPRVTKVWCAVDCGVAVNPNVIRAQMEGGIGYALGTILFNEVVMEEGGTVRDLNFHDYRMLRIHEMPAVEVHIVDSAEPPTGVGEPGVPPLGPAVANAWRALTGTAVHTLPFAQALA